MKICVFGASSDSLAPAYYEAARTLGEELARAGHSLVYGGGRGGLMGACASGVLALGGDITGVAPRFFDEGDVLFKEAGSFLYTDTMAQRKTLMEDLADAFVVLPGGIVELAHYGETANVHAPERDSAHEELRALLWASIDKGFTAGACRTLLHFCDKPAEVLPLLQIPTPTEARGISQYGK